MKRTFILGFLLVVNLALGGRLMLKLLAPEPRGGVEASPVVPSQFDDSAVQRAGHPFDSPFPAPRAPVPSTPFEELYSQDSRTFVANLRAIGCPEETVRDVMIAEIGLRFRIREEALRPTPADHVPFAWSANTSEAKILERRQQAATLAREKAALLREALGYELPIGMHSYAMTVSEQRFEEALESPALIERAAVRQAHENYWIQVAALQEHTRGFWLSEDVAELERLKQERKRFIEHWSKR
jgi:hypothetical protein